MLPPDTMLFIAPDRPVADTASGAFEKKILIAALAEPGHPGNRDFLSKVVAAANLNLETDALYAELPAGEPFNCLSGLPEKPRYVLIFGLTAAQAGLQVQAPLYQPLYLHGITWLFADSLAALEPDRLKKASLWNALKILFLNS